MTNLEGHRPRFLYISGSDGTGKSTLAGLLFRELSGCGVKCRRLWLRFPFFFSVPLLAYARWRGYSWHEVSGNVDHGYWDFSHSWVMRNLFPWVLLLDTALAALLKIYVPLLLGGTIVCERFVLDMLVDIAVATRDPAFSRRLPGKLFLALIPNGAITVILDLDQETICRRRPELIWDHALSARLDAFRSLASQIKTPLIDNHPPVEVVFHQLRGLMEAG